MVNIQFDNQTDWDLSDDLKEKIISYIEKTFTYEKIIYNKNIDFEVSYSWVVPETIQRLNNEYREIDKITDVLSFPMLTFPEDSDLLKAETGIPVMLGDIIINPERAEKQGVEYGTGFEREICYLTVHSMLHLLGYDHMQPEDKKLMRSHEKAIMGDD